VSACSFRKHATLRHSPDTHLLALSLKLQESTPFSPRHCGITHGRNFDDDTPSYFYSHSDVRDLGRCTANQSHYSCASTSTNDNTHSSADHRNSTCGDRSGSSADGPGHDATKYNGPATEFHDESAANYNRSTYADYHKSSWTRCYKRTSHSDTTPSRTHESGAR